MTSSTARTLTDPDQRRELVQEIQEPVAAADVAGEALRWVNHRLDRIDGAAVAYDLLGHLAFCLERMPQAVKGVDAWLLEHVDGGQLRQSPSSAETSRDVGERVQEVHKRLQAATGRILEATAILRAAQAELSPIYEPLEPGEEDPEFS